MEGGAEKQRRKKDWGGGGRGDFGDEICIFLGGFGNLQRGLDKLGFGLDLVILK